MKNYQRRLGRTVPDKIYPQAKQYLEKYWLDEEEYMTYWKPIQDRIFNSKAKWLPDMMFVPGFELMPLIGGRVFAEGGKDFLLLQSCMRELGDRYFVIVENYAYIYENYDNPGIPLRARYPVEVTWKEMLSGGTLSS